MRRAYDPVGYRFLTRVDNRGEPYRLAFATGPVDADRQSACRSEACAGPVEYRQRRRESDREGETAVLAREHRTATPARELFDNVSLIV